MLCRQKPPPRGFLTQFTFQSYHAPLFFHFTYKATWNGENQSANILTSPLFPNTPQFNRKCCAGKNPRPGASQSNLHFSSILNRYFLISILRRHGTPKSVGEYPGDVFKSYHSQIPHNSTGNVVQAKTPPRGFLTQFTFQSYHAPLFFHFTYKATWNGENQSANILTSPLFPNTPQFNRKCCAGKNPRPGASQSNLHFSSILNRYF